MKIEENASNYIPKEEEIVNDENIINERKENSIFNFLKSETGEGTIQSYNNHPLNLKSNNSISQIIRGLTGMLGSLNFAILDIILGGLGFVKEKKDISNSPIVEEDIVSTTILKNASPTIKNGIRVV